MQKGFSITHEIPTEYDLQVGDLQHLQYYTSGEIKLQRVLTGNEVLTKGHKLRIINDKRAEEIRIKRMTPGIAIGTTIDRLVISFEVGNALDFGSPQKPAARGAASILLSPTSGIMMQES